MGEQLYTIPVNDAFDADAECPICLMYRTLESNAIDFTMGPSYMEDDVRIATNKSGFCSTHIKQLYKKQNRLGLALMELSHMDRCLEEMEKRKGKRSQGGLFSRKEDKSPLKAYTDQLEDSCYICDRIEGTFARYIATIFYLYQRESGFVKKFEKSKGFCIRHYTLLSEEAPRQLPGKMTDDFLRTLDRLFYENMDRVRGDLQWFIDKFDYRNSEEPWKNSRDALIRTIQKMNSTEAE